jgi:hypothetical protein
MDMHWIIEQVTFPRVGILLNLVGALLLAFSVSVRRQYEGDLTAYVDQLLQHKPGRMEPTETRIHRHRLRWGGIVMAVGSVLQLLPAIW